MISLDEINNTIEELENSASTSFTVCEKLASLYIVREHLQNASTSVVERSIDSFNNAVIQEYSDILPSYQHYCEIKRMFQRGEVVELAVDKAVDSVCDEVREFLEILCNNTDTDSERVKLYTMLSTVVNKKRL